MARAGDDVAFGLEEHCVPTAEIWPRVDAALAAVRFPYGRDRATVALSGGEKQRLALAGVLALAPRVLLLDEPTANLDPAGARALYDVLASLPRTVTLVLVEHHIDLALELADRIVAIDGERGVVADGPARGVLEVRREEFARLGVWVPGAAPPEPLTQRSSVALIEAEGLRFRYPGSSSDALAETDATIVAGESLAIVGPNGAGKSTLLLLLAGLVRPQRGSVRAPALDPRRPEPWSWSARTLAGRIGSVFQDPDHQFLASSVRGELELAARMAGRDVRAVRHRADELLARLGIAHLADVSPFTLSGGEKRRLSVGTALAAGPAVLFLDEPTYGQDRNTFLELVALLRDARGHGAAICATTHERAFLDALGGPRLALEPAA